MRQIMSLELIVSVYNLLVWQKWRIPTFTVQLVEALIRVKDEIRMWIQSLSRVSFLALAKANILRSSFEGRLRWGRLFSSSGSAAGLVMANVTKGNFKVALEGLRGLVRDADFIAIDLEMSGLTSAPWRDSFEFDTLDVRYSKLADSARNFAVLQFGVCPFSWDSTSSQFVAHP